MRNRLSQAILIVFFCAAPLKPANFEIGNADYWTAGIGAAAFGAGYFLYESLEAPTPAEIAALNKNNINAFDRGAAQNWNPVRAEESDFTLFVSAALPATIFFTEAGRDDFKEISMMYIESMLLTNAAVSLSKGLAQRYRPFCYNNKSPYSAKFEPDARASFFSGHSANAFTGAVFLGTVYGEYFPDSKFKGIVWGGALLTAGYTAYLRVAAGKHFPTDVIAGAVVGSAIGYLVPQLHKKGPQPLDNPLNYTVSPVRITLSYKF